MFKARARRPRFEQACLQRSGSGELARQLNQIARSRPFRELLPPGHEQLAYLWRLRAVGLGERAPHALAAQVGAIHRRAGLLAPRLIEATGVDAVEAEVVEERDQDRLGARVVAGDRQRDAMLGSFS